MRGAIKKGIILILLVFSFIVIFYSYFFRCFITLVWAFYIPSFLSLDILITRYLLSRVNLFRRLNIFFSCISCLPYTKKRGVVQSRSIFVFFSHYNFIASAWLCMSSWVSVYLFLRFYYLYGRKESHLVAVFFFYGLMCISSLYFYQKPALPLHSIELKGGRMAVGQKLFESTTIIFLRKKYSKKYHTHYNMFKCDFKFGLNYICTIMRHQRKCNTVNRKKAINTMIIPKNHSTLHLHCSIRFISQYMVPPSAFIFLVVYSSFFVCLFVCHCVIHHFTGP